MAVSSVRTRRLGRALQQWREQREPRLTRADAATALEVSISTVQQWENGTRSPRLRDLRAYLQLLEVPQEHWDDLIDLTRGRRGETSWWTKDRVRPSLANVLSMEADASKQEWWSGTVIPGVVQTEAYARAVIEAAVPPLPDADLERLVQVRMRRQKELDGQELHIVLDEGAIRRVVGGPVVHAEQLHRLMELARSRLVTMQVLPYSSGQHGAMVGGFTLLSYADDPPVAYEERVTADLFTAGDDVRLFRLLFDSLRTEALPPSASVALISMVAEES